MSAPLFDAQYRRMGILRTRTDIGGTGPVPPLGDRLGVDAMSLGERPQALLTILYCSGIAAVALTLP